jgi:hypothetical protein
MFWNVSVYSKQGSIYTHRKERAHFKNELVLFALTQRAPKEPSFFLLLPCYHEVKPTAVSAAALAAEGANSLFEMK